MIWVILLNRCLVLAQKYQYTKIQAPLEWPDSAQKLEHECQKMIQQATELVEQGYMHRAVARIWEFINLVNAFMQQEQPWKTAATDRVAF